MIAAALALVLLQPPRLSVESRTVARLRLQIVRIRLSEIRLRLGLGQDRVGLTESATGIVARERPLAMINGCFFDAYRPDRRKNPNQLLISEGVVRHLSDSGAAMGFLTDGSVELGQPKFRYEGTTVRGRFYAYRANAMPTSRYFAGLYDRSFGDRTEVDVPQVQVADGVVTRIGRGPMPIPANGYVLAFGEGESGQLTRFAVGEAVQLRCRPTSPGFERWSDVDVALGGGPILVRNGRVDVDFARDGFTSPKILNARAARSAIGVTAGGELMLVVTTAGIRELARAMQALGSKHAINLDGGASSTLWVQGRGFLRPAGRPLSNVLLINSR